MSMRYIGRSVFLRTLISGEEMENKDIEYFDNLWQESKPKDGMKHTRETWDRIAQNWDHDSRKVRLKKDEKIIQLKDYLMAAGALSEDYDVLDLGCGPGKYGLEFAKHVRSVTLSDISPVMLDYARENALSVGAENVIFSEADFLTESVEKLGWKKKFDLVFTSLTPAMDNAECIRKINECSRKWAFNNSFVYFKDSLKDEVGQNVFGKPANTNWGNSSPYCIWNILWLMGLHPRMEYTGEKIDCEYELTKTVAEDAAVNIIRDRAPSEKEIDAVYRYLEKSYPDGRVIRRTESLYSWILWETDKE